MGLQFPFISEEGNNPPATTMYRLIALLALVACAFAEPEAEPKADAEPWYSYGYSGLYRPYTYGSYYPRTYGYGSRYLYKREAEAEPKSEADPWYTYGYGSHYLYKREAE